MARAGASMVQLYTSFGYRGVGTPRLIKDEITHSLLSKGKGQGSSWKSQIGLDYDTPSTMGWVGDEDRLRKTREQLMREAQGLGELLKDLQSKEQGGDDTSALVRMAEEALGKYKPAQPRDNLMGAPAPAPGGPRDEEQDHRRKERDTSRGLVEDTLSPHVVEHSAGPHTPAKTVTSGMVGTVPDVLAEVLPQPAADLAPMVVEETPAPVHEKEDEWTQTVRSGQRRLV